MNLANAKIDREQLARVIVGAVINLRGDTSERPFHPADDRRKVELGELLDDCGDDNCYLWAIFTQSSIDIAIDLNFYCQNDNKYTRPDVRLVDASSYFRIKNTVADDAIIADVECGIDFLDNHAKQKWGWIVKRYADADGKVHFQRYDGGRRQVYPKPVFGDAGEERLARRVMEKAIARFGILSIEAAQLPRAAL